MIPAEVVNLGEQRAAKDGTAPIAWESLGDFLKRAESMPALVWLLEKLVPASGRVEIISEPNAGKTMLALLTAKAGGECGRTVFLVMEEGGPKPTAGRFRSLGFDPSLPVRVAHLKGVTLDENVQHLATLAAEHTDPVFIFDPWVSISGDASENDTDAAKIQIRKLEAIQRANPRALIVLVHHVSKVGAAGEGSRAMASRGSTALPAWADNVLYLQHVSVPSGSGLVSFDALMAKNRDGERDYSIRVTISLGDGVVTYAPLEDAISEQKAARSVANFEDVRAEVLERLEQEPASATELTRRIDKRRADIFRACSQLRAEGVIAQRGTKLHLVSVVPDGSQVVPGTGEVQVVPRFPRPKGREPGTGTSSTPQKQHTGSRNHLPTKKSPWGPTSDAVEES